MLYINKKNPEWKIQSPCPRRMFLLELADSLTCKNMEETAKYRRHHMNVKAALQDCGIEISNFPEDEEHTDGPSTSRDEKRCFKCPRKLDKKVNLRCNKCAKYVCSQHRTKLVTLVCSDCYSTD